MEKSYVLFDLEKQGYAIDINLVIEVTELSETTKLPGADTHLEGILNLRGDVISIIDLKKRLGLKASNSSGQQILVVNKANQQVGIIVDYARDIRSYDENILEDASLFNDIDENLIESIINVNDEIIIALDIDEIISEAIIN